MGRQRSEVEVDQALSRMFRRRGFDGLSLSDFERETGMAKASLYYRFPEGKDSMARAVLLGVADEFERGLFAQLRTLPPTEALQQLAKGLLDYYDNGRLGCLLGAFAAPDTAARFRPEMQQLLDGLLSAIATVLVRLGRTKTQAQRAAEDFLADLQGSLVITAVSGEPRTFARRLKAAVDRLASQPSV
jgi:TetR/AcrR family transcriptional regulator, lmrAB and yxaGH operons repressor